MLRSFIAVLCLMTTGALAQGSGNTLAQAWNAVGRVDIGSGGHCTGVLIASDIVLTAAHCLYDKRTDAKFDTRQLSFRAGLRADSAEAPLRVTKTLVHPKYQPARKGELTNLKHDLALLQLASPVPHARATPMRIAKPEVNGPKAQTLSFGGVHSEAATLQRGCSLTRHKAGVLLSSCQAQLGTSGAPVVQIRGGKPHIVSIVSAKARADQQPVSLVVSVADALTTMQGTLNAGFTPARYVTP